MIEDIIKEMISNNIPINNVNKPSRPKVRNQKRCVGRPKHGGNRIKKEVL